MKILNKREKTWIILPANQDPLKAGNVNPSTEKIYQMKTELMCLITGWMQKRRSSVNWTVGKQKVY